MPRNSDPLKSRYVSIDDAFRHIDILTRDLLRCQAENRRLKERLGEKDKGYKYPR